MLATEVYKYVHKLNPPYIQDIYKTKTTVTNRRLRRQNNLHIPRVNSDYVGLHVRWNNTMSTGFNVSNGVRHGGILSPYLFCIYVDELSKMLNNVHVGCFVGTMLVNHLMYADDLVLLSPSAAGLSLLLSICSTLWNRV